MNRFSRIHLRIKDPYWYLYGISYTLNSRPASRSACCEFCLEPHKIYDFWSNHVMSHIVTLQFRCRDQSLGHSHDEIFDLCDNCASVVHKIVELYRKNSGP